MKRFFAMLMSAGALGLLVFAQTPAQELKHFSAKGLSFDIPRRSSWAIAVFRTVSIWLSRVRIGRK